MERRIRISIRRQAGRPDEIRTGTLEADRRRNQKGKK